VRASLRQPERDPIPAVEQLAVLVAAMEGVFDGLSDADIARAMRGLRSAASRELGDVAKRIAENQALADDDRAAMVALGKTALPAPGGPDDAKP
jgi:F-type H+-transporting ATPase subunit alpha